MLIVSFDAYKFRCITISRHSGGGGVASLFSFFFHDCCRFNIIEYRLSAEAFRNSKAISGFIIKEVAFGLIASAGKLDGWGDIRWADLHIELDFNFIGQSLQLNEVFVYTIWIWVMRYGPHYNNQAQCKIYFLFIRLCKYILVTNCRKCGWVEEDIRLSLMAIGRKPVYQIGYFQIGFQ